MVNGPLPSLEDQQTLLQDVRAKRDTFVQEKARIENLLNSYLEKVKIYQALLGATESQICKIEDLIGDIRLRLHERGILVNSVFPRHLFQPPMHGPRCCLPPMKQLVRRATSKPPLFFLLSPLHVHSHYYA